MFGGSTRCARCDKPCYAAEQVMGPGRKIYHKPCLTCTECNKRLDSGQLVEHDQEPYCKSCHMRLFGTRDLRHQNLTPAATPASPTKASFSPRADPPRTPPRLGTPQFRGDYQDTDGAIAPSPIPRSTAFSPAKPLPALDRDEDTPEPPKISTARPLPLIPSRTGQPPSPTKAIHPTLTGQMSFRPPSPPLSAGPQSPTHPTPITRPTSPPVTPRRPMPLSPGRTGTSSWPLPPLASNAAKPLFPNGTGSSTGSTSPAKYGGSRVECPRCGKAVYFAEQVVAVGKKWHKSCLRCAACSTGLDSSKLTERDGTPYCRACYAKNFGPAGSGYALLGR